MKVDECVEIVSGHKYFVRRALALDGWEWVCRCEPPSYRQVLIELWMPVGYDRYHVEVNLYDHGFAKSLISSQPIDLMTDYEFRRLLDLISLLGR